MSKPVASSTASNLTHDLVAGLVVFLVALPLCLGIALASGSDLFTGLVSGIVGGIVVGFVSGSHTSVSGPAIGLTVLFASQIIRLGSFESFMLSVLIAGLIQIGFGVARGGALSAFFPSSVVKGLLFAIGVVLIMKQIPHLFGHDATVADLLVLPQRDYLTTLSEFNTLIAGEIHFGATLVGVMSVVLLLCWDRLSFLKRLVLPAPLVVVLFGMGMTRLLASFGEAWQIGPSHRVQIPVATSLFELVSFLRLPDFSQLANPAIYTGAFAIAVIASLETLLNLEAVDKLDQKKRSSPASRELIAQGCGNVVCGMIGGLPVASVIVRGSVNVAAGSRTKMSTIFHGAFLLLSASLLPTFMNRIPLSALAAILLVTGMKLASPRLLKQMWSEGRYQFLPFFITIIAIVLTDLMFGILVGLCVSIVFILNSSVRHPIRRIVETYLSGDLTHIVLSNQVSFLNRAAIDRVLNEAACGSQLLINATDSDYIDPDVLSLIRDFKENVAPVRGITVSIKGFQPKYELADDIQFADYSTRALQDSVTADQVIEILRAGNQRFVAGSQLNRDLSRQVNATAGGQNPLAAVLSCIDSRVPAELVFDLGVGDIFSNRVAGNVVGTISLGSLEYAIGVAGVKLLVVLGHTRCGAVTSSINLITSGQDAMSATGCQHLQAIVDEIEPSLLPSGEIPFEALSAEQREALIDNVARRNVHHTCEKILRQSDVIGLAVADGRVKVVGAMYDVKTGRVTFFEDSQRFVRQDI